MKAIQLFAALFLVISFVCKSASYDLVFNTDQDLTQWKLNGSYIYSRKIPTIGALLPMSLVQSSKENDIFRVGLWLTRYSGPDAENFLSLHYALKHHLFKQGYVHFIASPNVPLTITTTNNQEVGKFWSDGKTWCDAIFTVDLQRSVTFDIQTQDVGDYLLIDKVIMGVMADLGMTERQFNPCLTSPPGNATLTEDDRAPDMAHKVEPPRRGNATHGDHTPPDMISKPSHHSHLHHSSGAPPPDMVEKKETPNLDTSTVTTSDDSENETEPETSDSSNVKCGCSCSCSRVKGKKNSSNNATMTISG